MVCGVFNKNPFFFQFAGTTTVIRITRTRCRKNETRFGFSFRHAIQKDIHE